MALLSKQELIGLHFVDWISKSMFRQTGLERFALRTRLRRLRGAGFLPGSRGRRVRVLQVVAQVLRELRLRHARHGPRLEDRRVLHDEVVHGDGHEALTLPRVAQEARQVRNRPLAENAHRLRITRGKSAAP